MFEIILFIVVLAILIYYVPSKSKHNVLLEKINKNINNYLESIKLHVNEINTFQCKSVLSNGKIFVSIASFCDPLLSTTIKSLILNCSNPKNLVICVYEQNDSSVPSVSTDEYRKYGCKFIRLKANATDAKGPVIARYIIQRYWMGEEYYLQIDSHTLFVLNWDVKCLENLNKSIQSSKTSKCCISNYVGTFDVSTLKVNSNLVRGPMYISQNEFETIDGIPRYNSNYLKELVTNPLKSQGWSGCFSFSSSQIILDAPYDPYYSFLFFGEESDIFQRLSGKGWSIYVPSSNICFTTFDRRYRKTFWSTSYSKSQAELSRLRYFIKHKYLQENQFKTSDMMYLYKLVTKEIELYS